LRLRSWSSSPNAPGRRELLPRAIATDSACPPAFPQLCRIPISSWPVGGVLAGSTVRGTPDFPLATGLAGRECSISRRASAERHSEVRRLITSCQNGGGCGFREHHLEDRSGGPLPVPSGTHKYLDPFPRSVCQAGRDRSSLQCTLVNISSKPQITQTRPIIQLGSEVEFEDRSLSTAHVRQTRVARWARLTRWWYALDTSRRL
jgi:hypothetical protein